MVATAATASFLPVPLPDAGKGKPKKLGGGGGGGGGSVNLGGLKQKQGLCGGLQVKANAQAPPKTMEKVENDLPWLPSSSISHAPRTFINQLPDWSMLLAAITTVFLAAEKQWMMLDWKPRRPDMLIDPFGIGKIVQDGLVFRQNFPIRSYEIGADKTASIETLMNHLQVRSTKSYILKSPNF